MLLSPPLRPLLRPLLRLPLGAADGGLEAIIRAMFAGGAQGAWYDRSDNATGYQDSTGLTPVTAALQSLGLRLDKRQAIGPELVTKQTFEDGLMTGWSPVDANTTLSVENGRLKMVTTAVGGAIMPMTGLATGRTYKVRGTIESPVGVAMSIGLLNAAKAAFYVESPRNPSANTVQQVIGVAGMAAETTGYVYIRAGAAGTFYADQISFCEVPGNHILQATAASRPVVTGPPLYDKLDGVDDYMTAATGGGGTTGFFWCGAVQVVGGAGGSRSVWSDTGTNTGYRVRITSTNKLAIGAGDGVAFTSATTTDAVDVGNTYVLTVWDDGVNLNAQVNLGTVVQATRPVVSAGTAGFTVGMENGSATLFSNIGLYAGIYKKNGSDVSAASRLACQRYCAAKAGITI